MSRATVPVLPNTLIHWPRQPPQELLGVYGRPRSHPLQKPKCCADTTAITPGISDSVVMQESQTGKLLNGLSDSRGFIVKESTSRAAQRQIFEEDSLDAWNKARPTVIKHIQQRQWLCEQPLSATSPGQWITSSKIANVLPAITPDTRAESFVDPYPRTHHSSRKADDKPTVSFENRDELQRFAREFRLRDAAMADVDTLRAALHEEQRKGVVVSRKGNTLRDSTRDVKVKGLTPNVDELRSITHSTYQTYDVKDPEKSSLRVDVAEEEAQFIEHTLTAPRHVENYTTSHSDSFTSPAARDPYGEMAPTDAFRKSHHFVKVQSTMQMPRMHRELAHSPLRSPRSAKTAAEIVPSQYTTSSMAMSASLTKK
eukprot:RCo022505